MPIRTVWLLLVMGLLAACETEPSQPYSEPTVNAARADAPSPVLHFNDVSGEDAYGTVDVVGLGATALARLREARLARQEWTTLLAVYTGATIPTDTPPMLGTYTLREDGIRFTPRFPLVAGLTYTARFDLAAFARAYAATAETTGHEALTATFAVPGPSAAPSTTVTHVYPTADILPMNQLKMYIHFSAPMRHGEAYDHIRLIDAETGEAVADPFVVIEQELWDAERMRFTLLFDPGRIKRNVRPNLEAGLPLQEGKRYRLSIDDGWRDAAGKPLARPFEKVFSVTSPDRTSPDYEAWVLTPPQPGTTDPVMLTFQEPLDHALLQRLLVVRTARGAPLEGTVEIRNAETEWAFIPDRPWDAGAYLIEVDAVLEDLAGNNLRNVFDVDLNEQTPDRPAEHQPVRLPFNVGAL